MCQNFQERHHKSCISYPKKLLVFPFWEIPIKFTTRTLFPMLFMHSSKDDSKAPPCSSTVGANWCQPSFQNGHSCAWERGKSWKIAPELWRSSPPGIVRCSEHCEEACCHGEAGMRCIATTLGIGKVKRGEASEWVSNKSPRLRFDRLCNFDSFKLILFKGNSLTLYSQCYVYDSFHICTTPLL